ncbi:Prevent-host-death family protein [Desulfamplus magnetovallimortis]|uniref:Antitoxin n=1 Tax=Desulfamplus magnetovallimortis TaxID=1246637 RepID=A0A1W1HIU5_9BACT|nr:type II toxin-antitoxin system prevent-host-death family antitoxin [Desulfamplus magnetovallimortis]SLM32370.1 Prevent-host-death family protein [Desulfamplus magnetovallimortis]
MLVVNAKEVREKFSSILDEVEKGEDIVITRRGKKVARIINININDKPTPLKALKEFRKNIKVTGEPLSRTTINKRDEERN